MPFSEAVEKQVLPVTEGNLGQGARIVLSTINYEDGLNIGRFAQIKVVAGVDVLSNLDGTASPLLAGVSLRTPVNPVTFGGTVGQAFNGTFRTQPNQDYIRQGLVTVRLAAGSAEPTEFAPVYTINSADPVIGLENGNVTPTAGSNVLTTAEFISKVQDGIWLINIK